MVEKEKEVVSWADAAAEEVLKRKKKVFVCEGMWTPSGFFHIGNARPEIFTPFSVFKALKEKGAKAKQNFVIDDFDAVRKIPSGLNISKEDEERFLGFPCARAPSPFPEHKYWADAFVAQVKEVSKDFGLELNFISAFETYKQGKLNDLIKVSLDNSKKIVEIWNRVAGADKPLDFMPIQVLCEKCKRIYFTEAGNWNGETVDYECKKCGHKASVSPLNGNSKLHWRVHWSAFWALNGVDFESAGKDHFSRGGSVDVSRAICKEVFNAMPPYQLPTEFILIGKAKMAGSVGNVVDLKTWLNVASPESFRFLNFSYRPNKVIEFDLAGNSFVLLQERFERAERIFFKKEQAENERIAEKLKRAFELSVIGKIPKRFVQVPYSFAVSLSQLVDPEKDLNTALNILKNTGHLPADLTKEEKKKIQEKLVNAGNWVNAFGGESQKISFVEKIDSELVSKIDKSIVLLLPELAEKISFLKSAEEIQKTVFAMAKENNIEAKALFKSLYLLLIGKERGPKIGSLVLALGKDRVIARLNELG